MRVTSHEAERAFVLLLVVFACVFAPAESNAQCNATTCGPPVGAGPGDINGDGVVHPTESLLGYVLTGDNPPASLCNAEINGLCNPVWPCEPTLGDVIRLWEYIFEFPTEMLPCELAVEPAPIGDMYVFPEYRNVPISAPGVWYTYHLSLKNDGPASRDLYAYTLPLEYILVNGGTGGDIDSMRLSFQNAGPGGVWNAGVFPHDPNGCFAVATPIGFKAPLTINAGSSVPLLDIEIFYTTGPGADNPRIEVAYYEDPDFRGHVAVLSLNGLLKSTPQDENPATEVQVVLSMGCDCPFQSDFDEDGFLTALDLGDMIDILFAGDPDRQDPDCPSPRADFDCDGFSTALDLGDLIDHLFAGSDVPCDPCTP